MLIQNNSNLAQAPQPARLTGDGAPNVVTPSNVAAQPSAALELPRSAVKQVAEQQPAAEQLKNVVDNINKSLKQANRNLEFSVDEGTEKPVFKLKDLETGDLIRQYPTEDMLAISRSIDQIQQGLLLKQEA